MSDFLNPITRRALLQKFSTLALSPVAAPLGVSLLGMANAAAQSAPDYKALVCVFLTGGNDNYNTVVPYDKANYDKYFALRKGTVNGNFSGVAYLKEALANTALASRLGLPSGMEMTLSPEMTGLKQVFDAGRAGILMNVGLLNEPTTKAQYVNRSVSLPLHLFSHTLQQNWLASGSLGWGGRMADLLLQQNAQAKLSTIVVGGSSRLLVGDAVLPYRVGPAGPAEVSALTSYNLFGSYPASQALKTLIRQSSASGHLMEDQYASTMKNALDLRQSVVGAIGGSVPAKFQTWFPSASGTNLAAQLQMVARLIEQGPALGLKRQVFMVSMGGFDTHDNLVETHPSLVRNVSNALKQFDDALVGMKLANSATAFTVSDFGRKLTANGDGTDHGWGGHQFIVGGAVNGNRFFGEAPVTGLGHNHDINGSLLPTTASDQMSAELGRWFGVSDSDIRTIFPRAKNFDLYKLGMFKDGSF